MPDISKTDWLKMRNERLANHTTTVIVTMNLFLFQIAILTAAMSAGKITATHGRRTCEIQSTAKRKHRR